MIIMVKGWRRILRLGTKILVLFLFMILGAFGLINFSKDVPVDYQKIKKEYWCQNPLQQERKVPTFFDRMVDQVVIKLQDYYYEERE